MEPRGADRRLKTSGIRWPERRTGFDRRRDSRIAILRDSSALLIGLLGLLNILNFLDLRFTMLALERGATEANPVMTFMLGTDAWSAVLFKVAVIVAVSVVVWWGRKYRRVLEFAAVATSIYAALIGYHIVGLTLLLPNA